MSERFCQKIGCSAIVRNGHHCDAGHLQDRHVLDRNYIPVDISRETTPSLEEIFQMIQEVSEFRRMHLLVRLLQRECEHGDHSDVLRDTLADGMHRIRMEKL